MSSERKLTSARANGAKAAGRKTAEGIARSAANAITHGLTSRKIVLSTESDTQFEQLRESYILEFAPRTQVEADLVDQFIAARWRLERLWSIETSLFDLEMSDQKAQIQKDFEAIDDDTRLAIAFRSLADGSRTLSLLNRYEARLQRACSSALESLRTLREIQELQNDPNPKNEHSPEPSLSTSDERHATSSCDERQATSSFPNAPQPTTVAPTAPPVAPVGQSCP
jgi:hypothetical protein